MPSLLHEGILELIRDRPRFVASLLEDLLHVEVPAFTEARLADTTLTQPLPTEYRADAVVLLVDDQPVFGCIVEAQLAEDAKKLFSWPLYAVSARARYACPFVLVVITPDERVASWAAQPIALGGGQSFRPLVLGPAGIPLITDPIAAVADPELALLSALAHARTDSEAALPVALAALAGISSMAADQQVLYFHLLRTAVGDAVRKAFKMLPYDRLEKYLTEEERQRVRTALSEGESRGLAEGLNKGLAEGLNKGLAEGLNKGLAEGLNKGLAEGLNKGLAEGLNKGLAEGLNKGLAEGLNKGLAEGLNRGLTSALLKVLEGRGLSVSDELRARIATKNEAELLEMVGRAALVSHAEELVD